MVDKFIVFCYDENPFYSSDVEFKYVAEWNVNSLFTFNIIDAKRFTFAESTSFIKIYTSFDLKIELCPEIRYG